MSSPSIYFTLSFPLNPDFIFILTLLSSAAGTGEVAPVGFKQHLPIIQFVSQCGAYHDLQCLQVVCLYSDEISLGGVCYGREHDTAVVEMFVTS